MDDLALALWRSRYRRGEESSPEESFARVARSLAENAREEARFLDLMRSGRFLPGGRILAGAGAGGRVTLMNCFVMGVMDNSMEGIFTALREAALTLQAGGGIGVDFSPLRPAGLPARGAGGVATGPVSFMQVWEAMCATVMSDASRGGAMMAALRCDHPDIERFIEAKREAGQLAHFNLSVLVSDAFLAAVRADADWPLVFPADDLPPGEGECVIRDPDGAGTRPCRVLRRLPARVLWEKLMRAAWEGAEPGVLFIDRINAWNNLGGSERIFTTNPCGELPLPPFGACDLGSLDLTRFVIAPFTDAARVDLAALAETAGQAVCLLDRVLDVSRYPLPQQAEVARRTRRVGLGLTGLGSMLAMLGLRYDGAAARERACVVARQVRDAAYAASVALARERGAFPAFEAESFLARPFLRLLPEALRAAIRTYGLRNSHLLAIAPTGSISLLAGNVSPGIEPVFAARAQRVVHLGGAEREVTVEDRAARLWREAGQAGLPPALIEAAGVSPEAQLSMQAAVQPFIDQSISKTVLLSPDTPFAAMASLYLLADALGLKGCTVYRPGTVRGAVLSAACDDLKCHQSVL